MATEHHPALVALREMPHKYVGGWGSICWDSSCNAGYHSGYCGQMRRWVRKHADVLREAAALEGDQRHG